jgi:hypothetical protein
MQMLYFPIIFDDIRENCLVRQDSIIVVGVGAGVWDPFHCAERFLFFGPLGFPLVFLNSFRLRL